MYFVPLYNICKGEVSDVIIEMFNVPSNKSTTPKLFPYLTIPYYIYKDIRYVHIQRKSKFHNSLVIANFVYKASFHTRIICLGENWISRDSIIARSKGFV